MPSSGKSPASGADSPESGTDSPAAPNAQPSADNSFPGRRNTVPSATLDSRTLTPPPTSTHSPAHEACDRCKLRGRRCDASPGGCAYCTSLDLPCYAKDPWSGRTERRVGIPESSRAMNVAALAVLSTLPIRGVRRPSATSGTGSDGPHLASDREAREASTSAAPATPRPSASATPSPHARPRNPASTSLLRRPTAPPDLLTLPNETMYHIIDYIYHRDLTALGQAFPTLGVVVVETIMRRALQEFGRVPPRLPPTPHPAAPPSHNARGRAFTYHTLRPSIASPVFPRSMFPPGPTAPGLLISSRGSAYALSVVPGWSPSNVSGRSSSSPGLLGAPPSSTVPAASSSGLPEDRPSRQLLGDLPPVTCLAGLLTTTTKPMILSLWRGIGYDLGSRLFR